MQEETYHLFINACEFIFRLKSCSGFGPLNVLSTMNSRSDYNRDSWKQISEIGLKRPFKTNGVHSFPALVIDTLINTPSIV